MRLSSFQIRNFKSVVDTGECHLSTTDNVLVLAGQNEAGKSAVIEALDFFRNGSSPNFDRLHRRKDEHPEVISKFVLEDTDFAAIFEGSGNEILRDYLTANPEIAFVRGSTKKDDFGTIKLRTDFASLLEKYFIPTPVAEEPKTETVSQTEEAKPEEATPVKEPAPQHAIADASKLESFLVGRLPEFVSFESFGDLLPGEVAVSEIEKYPAVLDFQKIFGVHFADVVKLDTRAVNREEQRLKAAASDNMNTYWTQKIEDGSKYNFTIKINLKDPVETASMIQFMIDRDDGDPLFMEQKSKGFRWFSAFNLRLRALGVEESKIKNLVILIDEPGQGLHEKAQRDVKTVLEELGTKGAQVIYTTHHPSLIGTQGKEFARIRLVSNTKNMGTKVETVAQFASRSDVGATDTLAPLVTAMGIHSVDSLVNKDKKNVVVEGISDHYYFSAFRKLLSKSDQLYFIPACGVNNIPNLVSTLIGWGFNYKAVLDDDHDSGRKGYNMLKKQFYENDDAKAHEHINKLSGCNGIEDIFTPEDFHQYVLKESLPSGTIPPNSELVGSRKEVLARLFLESVENGTPITLSDTTRQKVESVFDWLYQKFGIS